VSPGSQLRAKEISIMIEVIDTKGLKLPECIFKIAVNILGVKEGSILEVLGDCQSFEKNIRTWCEETGKPILLLENGEADTKIMRIQF
jgi:TusA-related sulfurtransferase